jgi:hypothetical protein
MQAGPTSFDAQRCSAVQPVQRSVLGSPQSITQRPAAPLQLVLRAIPARKRQRSCTVEHGPDQPHKASPSLTHSHQVKANFGNPSTSTPYFNLPDHSSSATFQQQPQHIGSFPLPSKPTTNAQNVRKLRRPRPAALPARLHGLLHSHDLRGKPILPPLPSIPPYTDLPTLPLALPRRRLPQLRGVPPPAGLDGPDRELHVAGV